jgi:hypothetical protein
MRKLGHLDGHDCDAADLICAPVSVVELRDFDLKSRKAA